MIYIGCHLSVTDGYEAMGHTMSRFGGNTFAWFTRNPRGGRTKAVTQEDMDALMSHVKTEGFGPLVAHGSYTMNLCSAKPETRANGLDMLRQDVVRMEMLPGNFYNFHPGSHTGQGTEDGITQIAAALKGLDILEHSLDNNEEKPQNRKTGSYQCMMLWPSGFAINLGEHIREHD